MRDMMIQETVQIEDLTKTRQPEFGAKYVFYVIGDGFQGYTNDFAKWRERADVKSIIQTNVKTGSDWTVYVRP